MALKDLRDLIYPASCLLCRTSGVTLCPSCEATLSSCTESYRVQGRTLYSSLHYNEAASHLILAAKEDNDRAAARYLAELMAMRFSRVHRNFHRSIYLLVPIPSSRAADKRRGYEHMMILAGLVAKRIVTEYEVDCQLLNLLTPIRKVADQSQLTARARQVNIDGAFQLRKGLERRAGKGVGIILIDDLVTTGSTMSEGLRALRMGSIEPDALLSACVAGRFLVNKIGL